MLIGEFEVRQDAQNGVLVSSRRRRLRLRRAFVDPRLPIAAVTAAFHALGAAPPAGPDTPAPDDPLTPATLDAWRDYIRPKGRELQWQRIGWRPSLWQGVLDAHDLRKPILLWAMNGHPMGST